MLIWLFHAIYLLGVSCMYHSSRFVSRIWPHTCISGMEGCPNFFSGRLKIKSPLYSINFILLIFIFSIFLTLFPKTLPCFLHLIQFQMCWFSRTKECTGRHILLNSTKWGMLAVEMSSFAEETPNDAYTTLCSNLIGCSTLSQLY